MSFALVRGVAATDSWRKDVATAATSAGSATEKKIKAAGHGPFFEQQQKTCSSSHRFTPYADNQAKQKIERAAQQLTSSVGDCKGKLLHETLEEGREFYKMLQEDYLDLPQDFTKLSVEDLTQCLSDASMITEVTLKKIVTALQHSWSMRNKFSASDYAAILQAAFYIHPVIDKRFSSEMIWDIYSRLKSSPEHFTLPQLAKIASGCDVLERSETYVYHSDLFLTLAEAIEYHLLLPRPHHQRNGPDQAFLDSLTPSVLVDIPFAFAKRKHIGHFAKLVIPFGQALLYTFRNFQGKEMLLCQAAYAYCVLSKPLSGLDRELSGVPDDVICTIFQQLNRNITSLEDRDLSWLNLIIRHLPLSFSWSDFPVLKARLDVYAKTSHDL